MDALTILYLSSLQQGFYPVLRYLCVWVMREIDNVLLCLLWCLLSILSPSGHVRVLTGHLSLLSCWWCRMMHIVTAQCVHCVIQICVHHIYIYIEFCIVMMHIKWLIFPIFHFYVDSLQILWQIVYLSMCEVFYQYLCIALLQILPVYFNMLPENRHQFREVCYDIGNLMSIILTQYLL